jgi:hypothetical protein
MQLMPIFDVEPMHEHGNGSGAYGEWISLLVCLPYALRCHDTGVDDILLQLLLGVPMQVSRSIRGLGRLDLEVDGRLQQPEGGECPKLRAPLRLVVDGPKPRCHFLQLSANDVLVGIEHVCVQLRMQVVDSRRFRAYLRDVHPTLDPPPPALPAGVVIRHTPLRRPPALQLPCGCMPGWLRAPCGPQSGKTHGSVTRDFYSFPPFV